MMTCLMLGVAAVVGVLDQGDLVSCKVPVMFIPAYKNLVHNSPTLNFNINPKIKPDMI